MPKITCHCALLLSLSLSLSFASPPSSAPSAPVTQPAAPAKGSNPSTGSVISPHDAEKLRATLGALEKMMGERLARGGEVAGAQEDLKKATLGMGEAFYRMLEKMEASAPSNPSPEEEKTLGEIRAAKEKIGKSMEEMRKGLSAPPASPDPTASPSGRVSSE